jgi:putative tryptophan/tyrosine transport system substrate-binding protein
MKRRDVVMALATLPALSRVARAQQAPKKLGVIFMPDEKTAMTGYDPKPYESFGWYEGRTLVKIRKYANWDETRLEPLARELVAARPDVLLTAGIPATRALQKATHLIPICTVVDDPVGHGFAQSLARPGGNITGLSEGGEVSADRMVELLRAAVPEVRRVAILSRSFEAPHLMHTSASFVKAAARLGITVDATKFNSRAEAGQFFAGLRPGPGTAIYLRWVPDAAAGLIVPPAIAKRIPVICQEEELVALGALMSFRMVVAEEQQFTAAVDRLLRGANPAVTPFELPTRSVFAINRKTATAIGVKLPADFSLRADHVHG